MQAKAATRAPTKPPNVQIHTPFRPASPRLRQAKRYLVRLAYVLIGIHFFLILNVSTHLQDWLTSRGILRPITDSSNYYGTVTFENRSYAFFAPTVASDWVVKLILTDDRGDKRSETMQVASREMQIKMYSMVSQSEQSRATMDSYAKSWAMKAANESKDVRKVEVSVSQNEIPTMRQFRSGAQIESDLVYRATIDFTQAGRP